jgi:hypothetical protein
VRKPQKDSGISATGFFGVRPRYRAPSGPDPEWDLPRVSPGLSFLGHFGPQSGKTQHSPPRPTPHARQLASIVLS